MRIEKPKRQEAGKTFLAVHHISGDTKERRGVSGQSFTQLTFFGQTSQHRRPGCRPWPCFDDGISDRMIRPKDLTCTRIAQATYRKTPPSLLMLANVYFHSAAPRINKTLCLCGQTRGIDLISLSSARIYRQHAAAVCVLCGGDLHK